MLKIYAAVVTTLLVCSLALNGAFAKGELGSSRYVWIKLMESDQSLTAYKNASAE